MTGRPQAFGPTGTTVPRYGRHDEVVGLPARAVALTNSERQSAFCGLKWYFGSGLGLGSPSTGPMRFGTGGHEVLEDVYRWWQVYDLPYPNAALDVCFWCATAKAGDPPCSHCDGTGLGPVPRIERRWLADLAAGRSGGGGDEDGAADEEEEEIPRRVERLRRVVEDYLHVYGAGPFPNYKVVGVEATIAMPIVSADGKPYAPEAFVYERPDGSWRFARPGDDPGRVSVQKLPYYLVGKLDAIIAHRETLRPWVVEHKLNASPDQFLRGITVDPQTAGYTLLLDHAAALGALPGVPRGTRAGGAMFDLLASGFHYDPEPLKSGGFSVAKRTVPSWRFERALAAAHAANPTDPKFAPSAYVDHLAKLRDTVDPKLYRREVVTVGDADRARFMREAKASAEEVAAMRRNVWRARTPDAIAAAFPRRPVCRLPGGTCGFRGPCASDGLEARRSFAVADGQVWTPQPAQAPLPTSLAPAEPAPDSPHTKDDTPWL